MSNSRMLKEDPSTASWGHGRTRKSERNKAVRLTRFVIEVDIGTLLVLVGGDSRFFVSLEPSKVLLVIPPRLSLQLPGCHILLIRALLHTHRERSTRGIGQQ